MCEIQFSANVMGHDNISNAEIVFIPQVATMCLESIMRNFQCFFNILNLLCPCNDNSATTENQCTHFGVVNFVSHTRKSVGVKIQARFVGEMVEVNIFRKAGGCQ